MFNASHSMLLIKMDDYFAIAFGAKTMAFIDEHRTQFAKIVDLPIEYDPNRRILVRKGWVRPLRQVNDRKPPLAKPDVGRRMRPTRVRPAVHNGRAHLQNQGFRHDRTAEVNLAGYAAHY
jgi:hypothetical protein